MQLNGDVTKAEFVFFSFTTVSQLVRELTTPKLKPLNFKTTTVFGHIFSPNLTLIYAITSHFAQLDRLLLIRS